MINKFLEWLQLEERSELTIKNYSIDLNQFNEYIGEKNIKEVTLEDLESYKKNMIQKKLAPTTINRKITTIKEFYKYLKSHKYIAENIATELTFVKDKREKEVSFLSIKEANTLIEAASHTKTTEKKSKMPEFANIRNELLIKIAVTYGLRNAEISGLLISDVDARGKVRVLGKREKIRYIYLNKNDFALYKKYLKVREDVEREDDNVFLSIRGRKLNGAGVGRIVKECVENSPIEEKKKGKITPHKLRHSCASNLILSHVPISSVSKLLGHNKVTTTMDFYIHSSNEDVREICQKDIYNQRECQ